jgi:ATP-binding cassette subfamily B (MDR/TAP) protein 1
MILVFLSSYALGFWYGKKLIVEKDYNVSDIISCFFCIMIGGASLGQSSPALKSIASAKSSAG